MRGKKNKGFFLTQDHPPTFNHGDGFVLIKHLPKMLSKLWFARHGGIYISKMYFQAPVTLAKRPFQILYMLIFLLSLLKLASLKLFTENIWPPFLLAENRLPYTNPRWRIIPQNLFGILGIVILIVLGIISIYSNTENTAFNWESGINRHPLLN